MRCRYCMPEDEYVWLPRESILTFEEIARLTGVFAAVGVRKVRLTGGEPLLRHDLANLVELIARQARLDDLAMTTNGLLLGTHAAALRAAGLQRVTVSLDTLRPERMIAFAKSARHADVLEGIAAARRAGFAQLKLNSVVIRGFNDDELADLVEFARTHDAEVRFIEYMDVGGATRWSRDQVVSQQEMLEGLARRYGAIERSARPGTAALPPNDSGSRTERPSGSSPQSARRSAVPAIAAVSPRTAPGSCACTPLRASIYGSGCAAARPTGSSPASSGTPGKVAPTAGRRSGSASRTGPRCTASTRCAPIRTARCIPGEGDVPQNDPRRRRTLETARPFQRCRIRSHRARVFAQRHVDRRRDTHRRQREGRRLEVVIAR